MPIAFAPSPRSTLGLEWELALVDQRTRELTNIAPELLPALQQHFYVVATEPAADELAYVGIIFNKQNAWHGGVAPAMARMRVSPA